jgi:multiple antibiotic resistance protein
MYPSITNPALWQLGYALIIAAEGLAVAIAGWKLLSEGGQKDLEASQEERPLAGPLDQAFHPLTLPLTTGPGAIAVVISLGLSRGSYSSSTDEVVLVLSTICAVS